VDAHLFRLVCEALIPCFDGASLKKIQAPASDVLCLSFYAQRQTLHLLIKYGRRDSFLCGVKERPAMPSKPSAQIMLLRKHVQGGRVRSCVAHWPQRCLYVLFSNAPGDAAHGLCSTRHQEDMRGTASHLNPNVRFRWLCLDLRLGPRLESWDCPPADTPVRWPSPEELPHALEEWRDWPVLTPALRRTLPLLEGLERQALLADLASGGGDVFAYGRDAEIEVFAWPLPDLLRKGREERIFTNVLEAAGLAGTVRVSGALAAAARRDGDRSQGRETRRLRRLLEKLDAEEARLRGLTEKQREGLALQAWLWRYPPDAEVRELTLDGPDGVIHLRPDPRYSLREYMERLFHSAGRGRRGLALLEQRRAELRVRLAQAEAALPLETGDNKPQSDGLQLGICGKGDAPECKAFRKAGGDRILAALPVNVQAFVSSDGIVMLRGRDAEGNLALLRLADPYDLWMHVAGGPGAHVLVRRESGQDIPRRSLHEAANLALVKSRRRGSAGAEIICAQARHVRPVKGGKPGSVRVDKMECALELQLNPDIELSVRRL
jgi:hypothetical protein